MGRISAAVLFAAALLTGFAVAQSDPPGLPNFHQVNDHIYRGGQPSAQGFEHLAKLGIKTVIDLREPGDRSLSERKMVEADGMRYTSVPMAGFHAPTGEQVSKVLKMLDDSSAAPVFIHCRRGADRTGTVIACYRVWHDHWENRKALQEAKSMGMSWLERAMQNYVLHYEAPAAVSLSVAQ
jgi:tyrosine-protein phosphatase SIW14